MLQRGTLWNEIERLKDKGNFLTEDEILQLLLGICRGLEAIHAQGYAHRSVGAPCVLSGTERAPLREMRGLSSPPKEHPMIMPPWDSSLPDQRCSWVISTSQQGSEAHQYLAWR